MNSRADQVRPVDFGALRLRLVRHCANGEHVEALLALEESGQGPELARGLWEYLERQMTEAKETALAEAVRNRLADAGIYTQQMAIADAEAAVERAEFHRAERILRSVFGGDDLPETAARIMGQAMAGYANPEAVRHLARLAETNPDLAILKVDVLRTNDELVEAANLCRHYVMLYPDDSRFQVRLARIAASMNKWDEALIQWDTLARRPGFDRSTALAARIRLLTRLERTKEARTLLAEFLLAGPSLSDLVAVAAGLGMTALMEEAVTKAAARHVVTPRPMREWDSVCQQLLDLGRLGQVAWLQAQGIPVGDTASEALRAARRVLGDGALEFASWSDAADLTSPACILPLPRFFRLRSPKPSVPLGKARVLLVNASLVSGGAERQFVMMVKALLLQGLRPDQIDVALFSMSKDRGRSHFLEELESTGVRIHDLQTSQDHFRRIEPDFEDLCQFLPKPLRGDSVALYHLVAHLRPTVLHGWQDRASLACGFVGAFLGTEIIAMSARNMQPQKRERGAQLDDRPLFKALCDLPNVKLTANSYAGARDYEEWLDQPSMSVTVLNNGLDFSRFANVVPAAERRDPNQPRRVNLTGVFRFAVNKRPLLWLETAARLQRAGNYDIRPRMVGVGPLYDQVKSHAQTLGLEHFELDGGLVDPADIYRDADVVLLMSRIEGTPNVLLEAQAMGIAAAGCDVGGVREAVLNEGDAAGLVMPEEITPEEAAQSIGDWLPKALAGSPDARISFIKENFSLDALGSRALAAYGFDLPAKGAKS